MDEGLAQVPVPVAELGAQSDAPVVSQEQAATAPADVEAGTVVKVKRKRKTTQNDHSHGSFFLRIGAIGDSSHHNESTQLKLLLVENSVRIGDDDLQWVRVRSVLRNTLHLSLLHDP